MQATVASFDEQDGSGSVVTDRGAVITFPAEAFARSGLRLLRPGQRVTLVHAPDGTVELVTIPGFPEQEPIPPRP